MSIIVSQHGRNAKRLVRTVIQQEDYLQAYITANPESLPLHELKDDLRLLILAREFPTSCGPIDALGVDADGDIYIVETKLYKNADKRKVIAQMLDYGAALWNDESADFLSNLERLAAKSHSSGLGPTLLEFFGLDADAISDYLEALTDNVRRGRFRFVVLMDRIDERLKNLISFVNTNSSFDILGVELDFYQHEGTEIIIPSLYGAEAKKEGFTQPRKGPGLLWNEERFFAQAEEILPSEQLASLRRVHQWAEDFGEISWGGGRLTGTFNAIFEGVRPRSFFNVNTSGQIALGLGAEELPAGLANQLRTRMNAVGILLPENDNPRITVDEIGSKLNDFLAALQHMISTETLSR